MASSDKRNSQAVEASSNTALPEEVVNPTVFIPGEQTSTGKSAFAERFHEWAQARMQWYAKILSGIVLLPLCIAQPDCVGGEVHVGQRERALAKPAAGVQANLENYSHPFRLIVESVPDYFDLFVRQFGLNLLGHPADPKFCQRVRLGKLPANCLVHELREKFQLQQGRVVADSSIMNRGGFTPPHVGVSVFVSDLARVNDSLSSQEHSDCLPRSVVSPVGVRCFGRVMASDIGGNPHVERGIAGSAYSLPFLNRVFITKPLSFPGRSGIVSTQAGRSFLPSPGINVATANIPVRRTLMPSEIRHGARVSNAPLLDKWIPNGQRWIRDGSPWGTFSTITLRGIASGCVSDTKAGSVSTVSHNPLWRSII